MLRALLIDAAGTLIEPAEPVADTYARLLAGHGHPLSAGPLAGRFRTAFAAAGDPDYAAHADGEDAEREWWRGVVEHSVGAPVSDAAFGELFAHYAEPSAWRVFPEVRAELDHFRQRGLQLAVVSNFDARLHPILDGLGLTPYFATLVTSSAARARKPAPGIFQLALARLGRTAAEVVHVGDSARADLDGARAAGIDAFLLKRPQRDLSDFRAWVDARGSGSGIDL